MEPPPSLISHLKIREFQRDLKTPAVKAGAKPWRSPMNRSNSMSKSLLVFFLDMVTGEVKNHSSRFLHLVLLFYLGSLILGALVVAPIFSVVDLVRGKPLEKGIRPMCAGVTWWNDVYVCLGRYTVSCWIMWQSRRAFVMLCGECRVINFGAPGAFLTELLSKCSPLLLPFSFQVRFMLVGFAQRRHGILKTHCFGLVAGDKCHDIADHFSYAGSGCHKKIE
ncbi:hypothetical protein DY000_02011900 [Brassica cretica]|uniref:Uncharacterized protein n=1 Tax=Brassica cretica TaxID=69181 RepID=A0ABQ7CQ60_BRACR|nr:hypothetical protein DY000_02011900 [Brassica cretica]